MRIPSDKTVMRSLRRELAQMTATKLAFGREADIYRRRASKAEQEVAEWKGRFDLLMLTLSEDVRNRMAEKPGIFGK